MKQTNPPTAFDTFLRSGSQNKLFLLLVAVMALLLVPVDARAVYFDVGIETNTEQTINLGQPMADLILYEDPDEPHTDSLKFEVISGSLPAGVVLDETSGKFTSTPTSGSGGGRVNPAVPNASGETVAVIRVTDTGENAPRPIQDYVTLFVTVNPAGPASGGPEGKSTLAFFPTSILADGTDAATVTLTLKDASGDPVEDAEPSLGVRRGAQLQPHGIMQHSGDGVYIGTVTSAIPGTAIVKVYVPGVGGLDEKPLMANRPLIFRNENEAPAPYVEVPSGERTVVYHSGTPVQVAPELMTNLPADTELTGARVEVLGYVHGEDELGVLNGHGFEQSYDKNGIVGEWVQATVEDTQVHVFDFNGDATASDYEKALQAVHYKYVGSNGTPVADRHIRVSLKVLEEQGWAHDPATGHFYESRKFPGANESWDWAARDAASRSFFGMQGYLATITSEHENDFITGIVTANAWIGAVDMAEDLSRVAGGELPVWMWMTGPETGQVFWRGTERSQGGWAGSGLGNVEAGMYENWNSGEPNRSQTGEGPEAFGTIFGTEPPTHNDNEIGQWNDLPNSFADRQWLDGYIIEYGGLEGDPPVKFFEDITVKMGDGPVVQFTANPRDIRLGEPVDLINRSFHTERAYGSDAERLNEFEEFRWKYGDGSDAKVTVPGSHEPIHDYTFTKLGRRTIELYGREVPEGQGDGRSDSDEQAVTVTADLRGYVFIDDNRDGARNAGESGPVEEFDVEVVLVRDGVIMHRAPDGNAGHTFNPETGEYVFKGLVNGDFDVIVIAKGDTLPNPFVPSEWVVTTPTKGEPDYALTIPEEPKHGAAPGDIADLDKGLLHGPNFGFAPEFDGYIVSGTVFIDDGRGGGTPNDGSQNGGEPGVYGIRLRIQDGVHLHPVLTDAAGRYEAVIQAEHGKVHLVLQSAEYVPTGYTPGFGATAKTFEKFPHDDIEVSFEIPSSGVQPGIDFGVVPSFHVDGTSPGTIAPGGVQVYPFRVTPGTQGAIEFVVETPRGWDYAIYHDVNGSGVKDDGDVSVTGPIELEPGMEHFLLEVRAPTWENGGAVDTAAVTATLTYAGNQDLRETQQFYSITTVRTTRLQLNALVRNVTQEIPDGGRFAPMLVEGKSGDVIEYRIDYHNVDVNTATGTVLYASVPEGTTLKPDSYSGSPVKWTRHDTGASADTAVTSATDYGFTFDVGDVAPGQSGSIVYRVTID